MTLEDLRALQDREELNHRHLIAVDEDGEVTIAHTREERSLADAGGKRLDECDVTVWAMRSGTPAAGIYHVTKVLGNAHGRYRLERAKVTV